MKKYSTVMLGMLAIIGMLPAKRLEAKIKIFSLVEKVQQSKIILIGEVKALHGDYVSMSVKDVVKGGLPSKEIEVVWDNVPKLETIVPKYAVGEQYLLFTSSSDARYMPFMGGQGVTKLEGGDDKQYKAAIEAITKYDVSISTEEIKRLLVSMLTGNNPLLQDAALNDFIYLDNDFKRRKAGIGEKELGHAVIDLTKHSDKRIALNATYALNRVGGEESVPRLIELVGDADESISQVAARTLSNKTGLEKTIKRGQPIAERRKIQAEWQEWWGKNKDKVKIRR